MCTWLCGVKKKQVAGKVWLERPLDAAGKRGKVLRGAGGSCGTVRKSSYLERPLDAAACWKGLETPRVAIGRCREAWEGFEGGRRQSRNRKKELLSPLPLGGKITGRCRETGSETWERTVKGLQKGSKRFWGGQAGGSEAEEKAWREASDRKGQ